jgi:hypothetical protein
VNLIALFLGAGSSLPRRHAGRIRKKLPAAGYFGVSFSAISPSRVFLSWPRQIRPFSE